MAQIHHEFDLVAIRRMLDREDWAKSQDNPGSEFRSVYLGSVFSLTPSGKYYMPFACGNLDACPNCGGTGLVCRFRSMRIAKRWVTRACEEKRSFFLRGGRDNPTALAWLNARMSWRKASDVACTACGGLGSREAYMDELWRESADKAFADAGLSLEAGEGDPCDMFAAEYRDCDENGDDVDGEESA